MKKIKNKIKPIVVSVQPFYAPEQSDANQQKFVWSYEVTIFNESSEIIQLLSRLWRITDMTCKIEEIKGLGVIGMQPLIKPGRQFVYTSYCQLTTPKGTMEGQYEMQNINEERFIVAIPKFILTAPATTTESFRSQLH